MDGKPRHQQSWVWQVRTRRGASHQQSCGQLVGQAGWGGARATLLLLPPLPPPSALYWSRRAHLNVAVLRSVCLWGVIVYVHICGGTASGSQLTPNQPLPPTNSGVLYSVHNIVLQTVPGILTWSKFDKHSGLFYCKEWDSWGECLKVCNRTLCLQWLGSVWLSAITWWTSEVIEDLTQLLPDTLTASL